MSYVDVLKEISKGNLSPLYLLYGSETYLIEDILQRIISATLSREEQEFNLSKFDMQEHAVEIAIEEAYTYPFMGGKRVVIVKNAYFLSAQQTKEKIEHDIKALQSYIDNPALETIFILLAPYEKLDERKKLVKLLKKQGVIMEGKPLEEKDLRQWIGNRGEEFGVTFDAEAQGALLALTSANLMIMASEIKKLALHVGEGAIVKQHHVEGLVARSLEQDIFALVDSVVKSNVPRALKIYKDLLKQKEAPLKIVALMVRQFRILYQVKQLVSQGYGEKMIASQLKLHPYVVKLAGRQVKKFDDSQLLMLIDQLAELDYQIKTGQVHDELGVELFLLKRQPHNLSV
ncbi:DNA polymerase III subunit delta [Salipaludibacillus agaradhaerens]|jgi:DNA polymerase-3 subunit delta|uniref:DNA polymerase III subunit delta n=1 Tax=Salipaludibacillus agaradhaerens TaxID=76935 RepID=UPI0009971427|nr:DNA polymerase III subunit delta [Salipaludibacillus agaradhaerens]